MSHWPAGFQSGTQSVPGAPAWPQSGAPGTPGAPAGPQAGAPNVPGASAGPQGGVPSTSASPPGTYPGGQASATLQAVGKGATRGLRGKLLGTTAGKVISAAIAAAVVATAGVLGVVLARPGGQPTHLSGQAKPPSPVPTVQSTPNGPPPDNASFTIMFKVDNFPNGGSFYPVANPQQLLLVRGGKVCGPYDDGKPHTTPDPSNPRYTDDTVSTCTGSYQGGKLTYTQTFIQFNFTSPSGVFCTQTIKPAETNSFDGTFASPTMIRGSVTLNSGETMMSCNGNDPENGATVAPINETTTWSGTVVSGP